jgi:hypothetical protein
MQTWSKSRRQRNVRLTVTKMPLFVDPDDFMIHLLRVVDFDYTTNPEHPAIKSLIAVGYNYASDLFNLNDQEVSRLNFVDDSYNPPVVVAINRGYQVRSLAIKAYRDHFEALNQREMTEEDWTQVTKPAMNGFIMRGGVLSTPVLTPTSTPVSNNAGQRANTALEIFRKTTRQEPLHFNAFNDKRMWASWKLQFESTARYQDLSEVLDPNYRPKTPEECDVFDAKQQYLYAVFVQVQLTDEGKSLVRQHQKDFDAQEIYKSLLEFHSQSMHAELTGTSIMSFLTSFKLGVNPWAGKTSVSFITYFVEQIRLYDELMLLSNNHVLSDSFKVTDLDQAVQQIEDLRQVRIMYSTFCLQLKIPSSFQGYFELLHKAATVYDAHHQSRSRNSYDSRKAFASNLENGGTGFNDDYPSLDYKDHDEFQQIVPYYGDDDINIDTPLSTPHNDNLLVLGMGNLGRNPVLFPFHVSQMLSLTR